MNLIGRMVLTVMAADWMGTSTVASLVKWGAERPLGLWALIPIANAIMAGVAVWRLSAGLAPPSTTEPNKK